MDLRAGPGAPVTERPLAFRGGSAEIARVARRAETLPAALRYEFAGAERPDLYLSFGAPLPAERDVARGRAAQEQAVEAELGRIEGAVRGEAGFEDVHRSDEGAGSDLATRALSLLTGTALSRLSPPAVGAGRRDRS